MKHNLVQFRFRRVAFYSHLKSKIDNILVNDTDLLINLIIDDAPITSRALTRPSHSRTSHLLSTSLSLGITYILLF